MGRQRHHFGALRFRSSTIVLIVFCCLLAVVALGYMGGWFVSEETRGPVASAPDLSHHPLYRTYPFGQEAGIIDFGIQPLWLPTSIIAEAMRHDLVLRSSLSALGFELRFHAFLKGADVNFFLQRGDLEVGIGGDMPALTIAAASDILVGSLIQQGFCSLVARRYMLIRELRGKRIGYAFGSNAHFALLQALSSGGLRETDVQMRPLEVVDMPQALARGEIEAFAAWEPTPSIAAAQFKDQVVIHRSLCSGFLYFSRRFADRYPPAVRHIVASQLRVMAWMKRRPGNLQKAVRWSVPVWKAFTGKELGLPIEQLASLANHDLLGIAGIPDISPQDLSPRGRLFKEFTFLMHLGKIVPTASWEKVQSSFDRTIMAAVLAARKTYQLDTYAFSKEER